MRLGLGLMQTLIFKKLFWNLHPFPDESSPSFTQLCPWVPSVPQKNIPLGQAVLHKHYYSPCSCLEHAEMEFGSVIHDSYFWFSSCVAWYNPAQSPYCTITKKKKNHTFLNEHWEERRKTVSVMGPFPYASLQPSHSVAVCGKSAPWQWTLSLQWI